MIPHIQIDDKDSWHVVNETWYGHTVYRHHQKTYVELTQVPYGVMVFKIYGEPRKHKFYIFVPSKYRLLNVFKQWARSVTWIPFKSILIECHLR